MKMVKFVETNSEMLLELLNSVKVGIWITDGDGKVVFVNDKSASGQRDKVTGKYMEDLLNMGYIVEDSSVLRAIKSKCESSIIQEWGQGGNIMATSIPIVKDGTVELVVSTERDITEIISLQNLLSQKSEIAEKYHSELFRRRNLEIVRKGTIINESSVMQNIVDTAMRVGKLDATIMITGESGTGKEMIADLIYDNSTRVGKPFIKVNCAAIPENLMESEFFGYEKGAFTGASQSGKIGYFELADQGTLFLDEVGDMPIAMQSKLLRVLQESEIRRISGSELIKIDVRIIAATNKNLKEEIEKGNFREDLYYRLNIIPIELPPLRQRKEDIPQLAASFVDSFNKQYGLSKILEADAIKPLADYSYPGNIRELRNIVERLMLGSSGNRITSFHVGLQFNEEEKGGKNFDMEVARGRTLDEIVGDFEKSLLQVYLEREGNASRVAEVLGVNKSTISRKLKKYNL